MSEIITGGMSGMQAGASIGSAFAKSGAVAGPAGAVIGGLIGVLGGIGARNKAKRQKNRMLAQINQQKANVRSQIPGVRDYFRGLSEREKKLTETKKGRAIDEFVSATVGTIPVLQRKIASTGLAGSGSAQKLISSSKAKLQSGIDTSMQDIATAQEEKELQMSRDEKNQLQSLYDQITMLDTKAGSL